MKDNIAFYRHHTNSHNHWKFKKLRRKYGFAGEGRFWVLNNHIADSENCKLDLSNNDKTETIAIDLDFDVNEFNEFISFLVNGCKLVKLDEKGLYYTDEVQEVFLEVMKKREKDRERKSTGKNSNSTWKSDNSTGKNNKVEEKRIEESKEEESTSSTTADEIKNSFLVDIGLRSTWVNKGYPKEEYEDGVQTFINQRLKEVYEKNDSPRSHFIYWMPNYPKATEKRSQNESAHSYYPDGKEVAKKYE